MDQQKIWDYFQGEGIESFRASIPRLDYLFRKACSLSKGRKLRVLNVGVGNGHLERRCVNYNWETHSLDPSIETIGRLVKEGIYGNVGRIESIPFAPSKFDVVFCTEVVEHLTEKQTAAGLREIHRVLKEGGYFMGTVPYKEDLLENFVVCPACEKRFHRWGHNQSFDKNKLGAILRRENFKIIKLATFSFVDFSRGTMLGKVGLLHQWALGRLGFAIALPVMFFMCRK